MIFWYFFYIGDLKCEHRRLIDPSAIEIFAPPSSGSQPVKITDGISSYNSPILFIYKYTPCQFNCSQPHGICDVEFGVCSCDNQTTGLGYTFSSYDSPILFEYINVPCLYNCSQPHGECNLFSGVCTCDTFSSYDSPILFEYINVACIFNCSQPHGECNLFLGICTCDTQTNGTGCEILNIKIHSIISTTINGGIGYIYGDFQFIISNFSVYIGEILSTEFELVNDSTIQFSVHPGVGLKNITVTDGVSSYLSPILFEYMNVPCLSNCSQPHGECNLFLGDCSCDTQTNGTGCENSRIYIDSMDPTDENGGTTYLYGYFGNTTSNLYIKIGYNQCKNTKQINETLIKCDVGVGSDRDLQIKVEKLFQYFEPITTNAPKQCFNECGGPNQGVCLSSGCSCMTPWIGNDCLSKIVTIPQPSINYSNPSTEIPVFESINNTNNEIENKLFISLISIVKLRELDFNS
ncbi:hypothetical protein ACTFIY_004891 [Dictyostelium cf. discoideum]